MNDGARSEPSILHETPVALPSTTELWGSDAIKIDDKLTLRPRQSTTLSCTNCS